MAVWVIRGGSHGEREEEALHNNVMTIGFGRAQNLADSQTQEDIVREVQRDNPNATLKQVAIWSNELWSFKDKIENGDLIVMPRKGQPYVAIGTMAGSYTFRPQMPLELRHGRPVEWINTEVSRNSLPEDLRRSLSANMTVFQPRATDAEKRLRAIATGRSEPSPHGGGP